MPQKQPPASTARSVVFAMERLLLFQFGRGRATLRTDLASVTSSFKKVDRTRPGRWAPEPTRRRPLAGNPVAEFVKASRSDCDLVPAAIRSALERAGLGEFRWGRRRPGDFRIGITSYCTSEAQCAAGGTDGFQGKGLPPRCDDGADGHLRDRRSRELKSLSSLILPLLSSSAALAFSPSLSGQKFQSVTRYQSNSCD